MGRYVPIPFLNRRIPMYDICKICNEKKATPMHVKSAHGMGWHEYKQMIEDPEFMADVKKHREEREERVEKEYHLSRLLMYYWFPKSKSLLVAMRRFQEHAKGSKEAFFGTQLDLSEFDGKDEAVVGKVEIAEAMTKEGWECLRAEGGWDGSPKRYIMRRVN